MKAVMKRKCL